MSISTFGAVHVAVSLVGIVTGVISLVGMVCGKKWRGWIAVFLAATVYTGVSGLMLRAAAFGPADVLGVILLPLLAIALFALYVRSLAGLWQSAYLMSSTVALYLNVFAAVVAAFQFTPALKQVTPSLANPPLRAIQLVEAFHVPAFALTQIVLIAMFIVLGTMAANRLRTPVEAS